MRVKLEKYIKRIELKIERYENAMTESFKTNISKELYDYLVPIVNELLKVKRNLDIIMNGVSVSPLDNIGDLFTLDKFKSMIEYGGITEYDGIGYYSDGKNETNVMVDLDDVIDDYTHVIWYNN